jgi:hypothetical protein
MRQPPHPLLAALESQLAAAPELPWQAVLDRVTKHFDCPVGTVHLLDPKDGMLHLAAQRGLPPPVLDKVA